MPEISVICRTVVRKDIALEGTKVSEEMERGSGYVSVLNIVELARRTKRMDGSFQSSHKKTGIKWGFCDCLLLIPRFFH